MVKPKIPIVSSCHEMANHIFGGVNVIYPTDHQSYRSFVLHLIYPTLHLSYTSFILQIISPTPHLSYRSFILQNGGKLIFPTYHLSYTTLGLQIIYPTYNFSYRAGKNTFVLHIIKYIHKYLLHFRGRSARPPSPS